MFYEGSGPDTGSQREKGGGGGGEKGGEDREREHSPFIIWNPLGALVLAGSQIIVLPQR